MNEDLDVVRAQLIAIRASAEAALIHLSTLHDGAEPPKDTTPDQAAGHFFGKPQEDMTNGV